MCRLTATCDNTSDFACIKAIPHALGLKVYFADPNSPWQHDANKNTNALLREYFPEGTGIHDVSALAVARAVEPLSNRRRKYLNYRTPTEVFGL